MGFFLTDIFEQDGLDSLSIPILIGVYILCGVALIVVMWVLTRLLPKAAFQWTITLRHALTKVMFRNEVQGVAVAIFHEVAATILSMASCGLFIYLTTQVTGGNEGVFEQRWVILMEFFISCFFLYDFFIWLTLEESKWLFFLRPIAVVNVLTIMPGLAGPFISRYFYGFLFLRFLRFHLALLSLRDYGVTFKLLFIRISHDTLGVIILLVAILSVLFCTAGFIFVVENSSLNEDGQVEDFLDSIYFIAVTVTTVGFGDITPKSRIGKIVVVLFIVCSLAILPAALTALIATLKDRAHSQKRYTGPPDHVVVCGNSYSLLQFWEELFHEDREIYLTMKVAVLYSNKLSPRVKQVQRMPFYSQRVTLIPGDPTVEHDLKRCNIDKARACFVLPSKESEGREAQDMEILLSVFSIRLYNPAIPIYAQINDSHNKILLKEAGVNQIVPREEVMLRLMAYNCLCPGITTLLSNLLRSSQSGRSRRFDFAWHKDYEYGQAHEIYKLELPPVLCKKPFNEVAVLLYHQTAGKALLFAVKGGGKRPEDKVLIVNPGSNYFIKEGDIGYCFCDNGKILRRMSDVTSASLNFLCEQLRTFIESINKKLQNRKEQEEGEEVKGEHGSSSALSGISRTIIINKSSTEAIANTTNTEETETEHLQAPASFSSGRRRSLFDHLQPATHWSKSKISDINARERNPFYGKNMPLCRKKKQDQLKMIFPMPMTEEGRSRRGTFVTTVFRGGDKGSKSEIAPNNTEQDKKGKIRELTGMNVKHKSESENAMKNVTSIMGPSVSYTARPVSYLFESPDVPKTLEDITTEDVGTLQLKRQHVILCGNLSGVVHLILPLREAHLQVITPVVILAPQGSFSSHKEWLPIVSLPEVYVVFYEAPLDRLDLKRAGAKTAANIIIQARGSKDTPNQASGDAESIMIYHHISKMGLEATTTIALEHASNVKFLSQISHQTKGARREREADYLFNHMYASGDAVFVDMLDYMLVGALFNDQLLPICNAFYEGRIFQLSINVMGGEGLKYNEFFTKWTLTSDMILLGLYCTQQDATNAKQKSSRKQTRFQTYKSMLGRKKGKETTSHIFRYVLTHPPPDYVLKETDKAFLLLADSHTWTMLKEERSKRKTEPLAEEAKGNGEENRKDKEGEEIEVHNVEDEENTEEEEEETEDENGEEKEGHPMIVISGPTENKKDKEKEGKDTSEEDDDDDDDDDDGEDSDDEDENFDAECYPLKRVQHWGLDES